MPSLAGPVWVQKHALTQLHFCSTLLSNSVFMDFALHKPNSGGQQQHPEISFNLVSVEFSTQTGKPNKKAKAWCKQESNEKLESWFCCKVDEI